MTPHLLIRRWRSLSAALLTAFAVALGAGASYASADSPDAAAAADQSVPASVAWAGADTIVFAQPARSSWS